MHVSSWQSVLRLILQLLSILGGLIGLFWFYCGVVFLIHVTKKELLTTLAIAPLFLGIGGYLVYICYLALFQFSQKAVAYLCSAVALVLFGYLGRILIPLSERFEEQGQEWQSITVGFAPLIISCLVYTVLKILLIRLTGAQPAK